MGKACQGFLLQNPKIVHKLLWQAQDVCNSRKAYWSCETLFSVYSLEIRRINEIDNKFLLNQSINQSIISRKVRKFGCLGYFCQPVFTLFDKKVNFLLNSYLDLYHLQGGIKFATQISHLLNWLYISEHLFISRAP